MTPFLQRSGLDRDPHNVTKPQSKEVTPISCAGKLSLASLLKTALDTSIFCLAPLCFLNTARKFLRTLPAKKESSVCFNPGTWCFSPPEQSFHSPPSSLRKTLCQEFGCIFNSLLSFWAARESWWWSLSDACGHFLWILEGFLWQNVVMIAAAEETQWVVSLHVWVQLYRGGYSEPNEKHRRGNAYPACPNQAMLTFFKWCNNFIMSLWHHLEHPAWPAGSVTWS